MNIGLEVEVLWEVDRNDPSEPQGGNRENLAETITFNVELVRASKACIDYVIAHELCHLIVPAHSRRFYSLLVECVPDWKRLRNRLDASI